VVTMVNIHLFEFHYSARSISWLATESSLTSAAVDELEAKRGVLRDRDRANHRVRGRARAGHIPRARAEHGTTWHARAKFGGRTCARVDF
jgi:hypothetical protein